jgi:hypothetical protein
MRSSSSPLDVTPRGWQPPGAIDDLHLYLVRSVELEVMHPAAGRGLHHLLEPGRWIMSIERNGEHDVGVRAAEVLAGNQRQAKPR